VLRKVKKNKEKVTCKGKKTNRRNTVMKNWVRVRYKRREIGIRKRKWDC
jgi:hypothetical protein